MSEKVEFQFFGSSEDAARALTKLENKFAALQGQIRQTRNHSKSMAESAGRSVGAWTANLAKTAAAYVGVTQILPQIIALERERAELAAQTERTIDASTRKLRVQAGLSEVEGKKAQGKAFEVANEYGIDPLIVQDAMRELISQGFKQRDAIYGDALIAALDTMAATNTLGEPPEETIRALSGFLIAKYGTQGLTPDNLRNTGTLAANLFQGEAFQLEEFTNLAKVSGGFERLTEPETEGAFSSLLLRAKLDAASASVAQRQIMNSLQTAAAQAPKTEALASLGLKPTDVDMVGESFTQVQQLLTERIDEMRKTNPEDLMPTLSGLFESRFAGPASVLFSERGDFTKFRESFEAPKDIQPLVDIATGGETARQQRAKNRQSEQMLDSGAAYFEDLLLNMENEARDRGKSSLSIGLAKTAARFDRFVFGSSPAEAAEVGDYYGFQAWGSEGFTGSAPGSRIYESAAEQTFLDTYGKQQLQQLQRIGDGIEMQNNKPRIEADAGAQVE